MFPQGLTRQTALITSNNKIGCGGLWAAVFLCRESALGQKRKSVTPPAMSAFGGKADVNRSKADITSRKLSGVTARADTRLDHWHRRGYGRPCLTEKILLSE